MVATVDANVQELDGSHSPQNELQFRTYPGRYYVLIVAVLLCMHQCLVWITFGPIPGEAKDGYGLTDIEITLLPGNPFGKNFLAVLVFAIFKSLAHQCQCVFARPFS